VVVADFGELEWSQTRLHLIALLAVSLQKDA